MKKSNQAAATRTQDRVHVKGKFLYIGEQKFYAKGVTYGTFKPDDAGLQFPPPVIVEKDFALMAQNGFNSVRTYTVPPHYVLDIALHQGLKVMAGLPWEQHITFLDSTQRKNDIIQRVKEGVASCNRHPAILCYTIGNEIPAPIVRWYGKKKIEAFLKQLFHAAKEADPYGLVTYVNYPTTEYLSLHFLDFDCFNVYLETPENLGNYIARLHNLSGDRPLLLAEIGLDSNRNGTAQQAAVLTWQTETIFGKGCAGMFVFAWTDEWWRGGFDIEDWDFGLVDRQRIPKPALFAVSDTMHSLPVAQESLPFISVVVCSYNGAATIRDCLEGIGKIDYSRFEVIVVNDGSKDGLPDIVNEYPVQLITIPNRGLSSARNTGMRAATGEIIAYIDDDAYPDPHWLCYLAYAYTHSTHACIGGPNIVPEEDGPIAKCVANAPGGPVHVLLTDELAEHVPGCNMSFRREALLRIGGFDPLYQAAGDDVDVCWRIQKSGGTIGFHPAAVVWHHRRNSIKAYWKQQKGYGKAEALLEAKWPEKYNGFGHLAWTGRIYGNGFTLPINIKKGKVFHGTWGTALFQSVYQPADHFFNAIPLMPEWYLFSGLLAGMACLGFLWSPFLWIWPLFMASVIVVIIQAVISTLKNTSLQQAQQKNIKYQLLITFLHIIQPMARLYGRLKHGLTPWNKMRSISSLHYIFTLRPRGLTLWSEEWRAAEAWLEDIEKELINLKARVQRGGDFDRWDIQARNSMFSKSRGLLTIEEHGGGRQLLRFKVWTSPSNTAVIAALVFGAIAAVAFLDKAVSVAVILGLIVFGILAEYLKDSAGTLYDLHKAFKSLNKEKVQHAVVAESVRTRQENVETESHYLKRALFNDTMAFQNAAAESSGNDFGDRARAFDELNDKPTDRSSL